MLTSGNQKTTIRGDGRPNDLLPVLPFSGRSAAEFGDLGPGFGVPQMSLFLAINIDHTDFAAIDADAAFAKIPNPAALEPVENAGRRVGNGKVF
jgi:hypothetical protein